MIKTITSSSMFFKRVATLFTLALIIQAPVQAVERPDGVQRDDPNPGSVPDNILGEFESLEIANIGGHKIYAGTGHDRNKPSYLNVDFKCNGTGTYEAFYSDEHSYSNKIKKGTFAWTVRDDGARVKTKVIEATEGPRLGKSVDFSMKPRASSAVVVGQTLVEELEAARIVQHSKCDGAIQASNSSGADSTEGYSRVLFYKNPGAIPSPILEEVDEIVVANLGGIKVFGGPDRDHPSTEEYFNIQFDCDGTGTFETYPQPDATGAVAILFKETEGTLIWSVKKNKQLQIDIEKFTKNKLIAMVEIDIDDTISLERVAKVGVSRIEEQVISRMVRFKECG